MASGRRAGLLVAMGITTGSLSWSIAAALGLGAIMLQNSWLFEIIRYAGAAYLLFLAFKSARAAMSKKEVATLSIEGSALKLFTKGLLLHLTNPKAILFFGALYSIGVPPGAGYQQLLLIVGLVGIQSFIIFNGYALLFSIPWVTNTYVKLRAWFDSVFALGFAAASLKVLTAKLN